MNNNLIERIEAVFAMNGKFEYRLIEATKVLSDCKAEIERLTFDNANGIAQDGTQLLDAITSAFRRGFAEGKEESIAKPNFEKLNRE